MKKLVLALLLVCCFWSTYLYAEEVQPKPNMEQLQPNQKAEEVQPKPKFASFIFSLAGGGFFPEGDYNGFDTSYNGTLSLGVTLGRFFGASIDIGYEQTDLKRTYYSPYGSYSSNSTANTVSTFGLDYLFYFQPNQWRVQPYIAAGFGLYFNHVDNLAGLIDNSQNYIMESNSGTGLGVVGKAGIRFFITEHFFLGAYGKYYTNWQELKLSQIGYGFSEENKTLNLGGAIANFEIGGKF
jgi:outer membrane protein W